MENQNNNISITGDGSGHYGGDEIMRIMDKYGDTPAVTETIKHLLRKPKATDALTLQAARILDLKKVLWYTSWQIQQWNPVTREFKDTVLPQSPQEEARTQDTAQQSQRPVGRDLGLTQYAHQQLGGVRARVKAIKEQAFTKPAWEQRKFIEEILDIIEKEIADSEEALRRVME